MCVSQQAELSFLEGTGVTLTRWGTVVADDTTGETTAFGVYAAGDVVSGPSTVIEAVAAGQRVAEAILRRDGREPERRAAGAHKSVDDAELWRRRAVRLRRPALPERPAPARRDFSEVTPVIDEATARGEGQRCLLCNEMCNLCVTVCPNRANHPILVEPVRTTVPRLLMGADGLQPEAERRVTVAQRRQIVNFTNLCNECGNCVTFCPTAGAPYRDKPRLHLDRSSYEGESDRALFLEGSGEQAVLRARVDGEEHWLRREGAGWRYGSPRAEVSLDAGFALIRADPGPDTGPGEVVDLDLALQLQVLLQALPASFEGLM
jgi:ferredoxin